MKLRRFLTIGFLFIVVLVLVFINLPSNEEKAKDNKEIDLTFADNYISYVLNNETVSVNIFGAKKNIANLSDTIAGLELNNENIKIVEYEIDSGKTSNEHQLFNLMLDIKVLSNEIEKADTLRVTFDNNDSQEYNIGQMVVANEIDSSDHISYGNEYNVGYPEPSLVTTITNTNDESIIIKNVSDLNKMLFYEFSDELLIDPGKSYDIDIPSFENKESIQYDFYTITPIIYYKSGGNEHVFDLPTVIYGLLDDDDEKLWKVLN
ncbi:hypothetical protein GI584_01815 [Gracilibacillus salitolerans]|uniref:Uncharacterized protein n=1 Tax=Gracilibacillus salitolerans TaxID=2663022 RepID=A0A5Q2TDR8_9BACI|nr:hypothetical protein [Gracilibacillus salitolerans]QGH32864.1 hypothetical protein GI584_01815 [Gracilibacillus salitolerans]